jgi:hypothetical protein
VTIEFLDPDEPGVAGQAPVEAIGGEEPQRRRPEFDREAGAALVLFAGAAVLAVLASFQTVSTEIQRSGNRTNGASVDGWGRWHTVGTASVAPGVHDARYGIPLCACGLAFAVAAGLLAAAVLRGRNPRTATSAALLVGAGATSLAGVIATMWLQIDAVFDSFHATTSGADDLPQSFGGFHLDLGGAIWLALAGLVAALLGGYACLRVRARWDTPSPVATSPRLTG